MAPSLHRVSPDGSRLSDRIARTLLKEIISGELQAGDPLAEVPLAARFKTSRAPVREALYQLEQEGLVAIIPRVGAQVKGFTAEDINDIYDLRIALEVHALRRMQSNEEVFTALQGLIDRMRSAVLMSDSEETIEPDLNLHEMICRLSGNKRLLEVWSSLRVQAKALYVFMLGKLNPNLEALADSHQRILDALRDRDTESAVQRLVQHIEATRAQLTSVIEARDRI